MQQALRREHVLDFGRADAERERRERAVRAGVRIAADDRHAGQRRALLRPDHVDDALAPVEEREVRLGADARRCWRRASRPACARSDRGCPCPSPWSACCGRRWRRSTRRATACGRRASGLRTPAGSSLRAPGGGRCRAAPCRPSSLRTTWLSHNLVVERACVAWSLRARDARSALPDVDYCTAAATANSSPVAPRHGAGGSGRDEPMTRNAFPLEIKLLGGVRDRPRSACSSPWRSRRATERSYLDADREGDRLRDLDHAVTSLYLSLRTAESGAARLPADRPRHVPGPVHDRHAAKSPQRLAYARALADGEPVTAAALAAMRPHVDRCWPGSPQTIDVRRRDGLRSCAARDADRPAARRR